IRLRDLSSRLRLAMMVVCASLFACGCWANDAPSLPNAPAPSASAVDRLSHGLTTLDSKAGAQAQTSVPRTVERQGSPEHRFWDGENAALFSLVGASRALDYSSTLNMRRRGRQEILLTNDVVDNHAAFAAIEAGGTAVSIGASYLFHRYHHHRLERWTSIIHASLATGGAVRNYCLKTAHPSTRP